MPISYQAALRLYAKSAGEGFMIPKKGTPAYEAVKKLQMETADAPEHAIKKRSKKEEAFKKIGGESDLKAGVKGMMLEPPPAPKTTPIDTPIPRIKQTKVLKDPEEADVKPRKPRQKKVDAQQFIENRNTGPSAVITTQTADQARHIKEELSENKKTPKIVSVNPNPPEKTIDGLKTNDPKAIEGKEPFSMTALRLKLRC